MAKKDNDRDKTPIQFSDPPWSTKSHRIPFPINQPNWKYKTGNSNAKPDGLEWLLVGIITAIEIMLVALFYYYPVQQPGVWIILIGWTIFTTFSLLRFIPRVFSVDDSVEENYEEEIQKPKKEKKRPKRRKDYR